ncbi:MAG: carbohydrate ABC transporter permease, partial [Anaerolineae bacterium]|nr:carbohydrate ABC transporter permease [Anaerolineae bacterium]
MTARPRTPLGSTLQLVAAHIALLLYTVIALFPIVLIVLNSFKTRNAIFRTPYAFPDADTFSLVGYETVFARGNFPQYFA